MTAPPTTTTLATFLLARIAEDEAAARAAALMVGDRGFGDERIARGQHWVSSYHNVCRRRLEDNPGKHVILEGRPLGLDAAKHTARHDPARVLAQAAALRAVVELHADREVEGQVVCSTCTDRETFPSFVEGVDTTIVSPTPWPCPTLRALASTLADHPEWREEWR